MLAESTLIEMLRKMFLIRRFEERVMSLFEEGLVRGPTHVYIGEEATAVGACASIDREFYITSTHRGHGHLIAKGGDVRKMMAELLGKEAGYCKGRGGSMHIAALELGILGANGIVGAGIPIAAGVGLASRLLGKENVVLCFFGDGATNTGSFHEGLNLASIWNLPVIFICENNQYAVSTPAWDTMRLKDVAERAKAYGIPSMVVDGNDVLAVYDSVGKAYDLVRRGKGPVLVECKTYRHFGHYVGDPEIYRSKDEVAEWRKKDPIKRFSKYLLEKGILKESDVETLSKNVSALIDEAEEFARACPEPSAEKVKEDLFTSPYVVRNGLPQPDETTRRIAYRQAVNEALREEMKRDDKVILLGEDMGPLGGAFSVTKGLFQEFGKERVRNTPISEAAIIGASVGAALVGLRPVAEIMYIDFTGIAMDQIVNQAAKMRYMFGGKAHLPVVIRTQCGAGMGGGPHHSQSLEAWFYHVPGLKVAMPSTPYDAKGLLKYAIREDNPTVFIESKRLYGVEGPVPEEEYVIPFGVADIKRKGEDITIVALGAQVHEALRAADMLHLKHGIEAEVIDPRTLQPLDEETILGSVRKTGRLLVVHDAIARGGVGSDIVAMTCEKSFDFLDVEPVRLGGLDVPMPYAKNLEAVVMVNAEKIVETVRGLIR